jgi:tRNA threonylcarbamoyladenosine biosynthesis protein TsaE
MSTDTIWHYATASSEETESLGAEIGARLRGGEVIELRSDLGGGKTTLVRGIAEGARSRDAVGSPSFTISREYTCPDFVIHHYDFYRLAEAGLMSQELADVLTDPKAVIIVEWAEVAEHVLPNARVIIKISATGDESRVLDVTLPENFSYLKGDKS